MKRYWVTDCYLKEKQDGPTLGMTRDTAVVLAADHAAALSVLRRCVEAMELARESILAEWSGNWPDEEGIGDAISAARKLLEGEGK